MRIFISGSISLEREEAFNQKVCDFLESKGHDVFLPQRDYENITDEFDLGVFISNGRSMDVGPETLIQDAKKYGAKIVGLLGNNDDLIRRRIVLFDNNLVDFWVYSFDELNDIIVKVGNVCY